MRRSQFLWGLAIPICALVGILASFSSSFSGYAASSPASMPQLRQGATCWVVRTFGGHGAGLRKLLESLVAQRDTNWVALIVNTDSTPYPGLREMVAGLGDKRVVVLSELAQRKFSYFEAGYRDTDSAIRFAARTYGNKLRWLVCTNGDNYYDPRFLDMLDPQFDVVGADFFSRWDDFSLEASRAASPQRCKVNTFQRGMTDLGSNAWNFQRWVAENITFSAFTPNADESLLDQAPQGLRRVLAGALASQDGQVAEWLVRQRGWPAHSVHRCLFSHSPNPWECKRLGGVWLDSPLRAESSCLQREELAVLLRLRIVGITSQPGDLPDFARFERGTNESKYGQGMQVERDIESWVGRLSKMVKREGDSQAACLELCFAPSCSGGPGVLPNRAPCDGQATLRAAESAGWRFDEAFYGDNPVSRVDLLSMSGQERLRHFLGNGVFEGRPHRFTHPRHGSFTVNFINISHDGAPPPRGTPGKEPTTTMLASVIVQGLKLRQWA